MVRLWCGTFGIPVPAADRRLCMPAAHPTHFCGHLAGRLFHDRTMKKTILLLAVAALLGGCAAMGPKTIPAQRAAYNVAVQQSAGEELLLNLVRVLYRDPLYFTTVERVAASMTYQQDYGVGAEFGRESAGGPRTLARALSLNAGAGITENPTIFYAPVEGEMFVRQMMTPMNPELLLLMVKSGWSVDRVLRVGVQEINGLKNAPTAAGPTPSREPEFRDFLEAVKLLRALQREQLLDLAASADGKNVELCLAPAAAERAETARLRTLLKLAASRECYRIVTGSRAASPDTLALTTRPLLSALSYLAQGIQAPAAHIEAGQVRRTVRADQQPFEWQELLGELFQVRSAEDAPAAASVAVRYNGHWFFIPANDLETKSTFVLLTQLMALHSAPASGPAMSFSFGN
ncbi:MAG: hypothetical protein K0S16_1327 [Moraxellaceae bacterium]|nr:hypothetical protein [Moraxellaceae bacterium]